jgi:hypothetical protein
MSQVFSWVVTLLVAIVIGAFAWYLVSLRHLPTTERPRTRTFDRLGRFIGERENPDYHENPGEDSLEDPDIAPDEAPEGARG